MKQSNRDLAELKAKFEELKTQVGVEAKDLVDEIESKIDSLTATVQEEIAEYKEVGLMRWVQLNPRKACIVAGVAGAVILFVGVILGAGGSTVPTVEQFTK